jgi:hypothetical protein
VDRHLYDTYKPKSDCPASYEAQVEVSSEMTYLLKKDTSIVSTSVAYDLNPVSRRCHLASPVALTEETEGTMRKRIRVAEFTSEKAVLLFSKSLSRPRFIGV